MAKYPKYPAESKDLMISLIAGTVVALVALSIDILNEINPPSKIMYMWAGFIVLFVIFVYCVDKFKSLKEGPLKRKKRAIQVKLQSS